jgi:O-succinylbenzoic acid--CoA ligase
LAGARESGLPLAALLLLPEPDPVWGQRLVALVRPQAGADAEALIAALRRQVGSWPPAERPRRWLICPTLAPTAAGKWRRGQWQDWLQAQQQTLAPDG